MSREPLSRAGLAAGGILALGVAAWALWPSASVPAPAPAPVAAPAPAPAPATSEAPAVPDDPAARRARLEQLRYLEARGGGSLAVIDDAPAHRTYFVQAAQQVLGARVVSVTPDRVILEDAVAGRVDLPRRGRETLAPAPAPAFEVRGDRVPVVVAPSVDPVQAAMDQAIIDAHWGKVTRGTGKGRGSNPAVDGAGGGGRGAGRDPNVSGGPGRQRRLAEERARAQAGSGAE